MFFTIFVVFLFVLFGTNNGRRLCIKVIRKQTSFMPLALVRFSTTYLLYVPHFISKTLLDLITYPIDSDKSWIQLVKKEGWKGYWIQRNVKDLKQITETAPDQDLVVLYIHGGGFAIGNALVYLPSFQLILNTLSREYGINASILSVEYDLSRQSVWPKASDQCFDAYQYLIHEVGIRPTRVVIMGDSAGGNLVCTTLLKAQEYRLNCRENNLPPLPLPAGAVLISPWLDLSVKEYPNVADILTTKVMEGFISHYIPFWSILNKDQIEEAVINPLVSPLFGDFSQIRCPFFVSYGEYELIRPGIESFILNLKEDRHDLTVFYGEKKTHCWFASPLTATSDEVFQSDYKRCIQWLADRVRK